MPHHHQIRCQNHNQGIESQGGDLFEKKNLLDGVEYLAERANVTSFSKCSRSGDTVAHKFAHPTIAKSLCLESNFSKDRFFSKPHLLVKMYFFVVPYLSNEDFIVPNLVGVV